jgi:hypothetical protein
MRTSAFLVRRSSVLTRFAAFLVLIMGLIGCGGGGGGSTGGNTLRYVTEWSGRADPTAGSGQSQLITVSRTDGSQISQFVLNRSVGTSVDLGSITESQVVLTVDLYSQADAGGVRIGQIVKQISPANDPLFQTQVGGSISAVEVTPSSASFSVESGAKYYAVGVASTGKHMFTEIGAFAWSGLGGTITVNQNGQATGLTQGTGTVRAIHTSSAIVGTAVANVTAFVTQRSKWTVLVYLNAANDLYQYSDVNVNQMETVADNPQVRFVVQWKQSQSAFPNSSFTGTRRYLLQSDNTASVRSNLIQDMGNGVDMGDPNTLKDFIAWGKRLFPSDHTVLIVWNHGSGWSRSADGRAVSYDDELNTVIQTWQLPAALAGNHFDIIGWDASLMQMAEVAYEVKDFADFVAGSEESPPGEGYPYQRVFKPFRDNPDASVRDLSKGFVDGMINEPNYASRKITQSVIETAKLPALATAMSTLTEQMVANRTAITAAVQAVRTQAQSFSPSTTRYFRDLRDVVQRLRDSGSMPGSVLSALNTVDAAAADAVVWEGHNANSAGSKGIAVDFSPGSRFASIAVDYDRLAWDVACGWGDWLRVAP